MFNLQDHLNRNRQAITPTFDANQVVTVNYLDWQLHFRQVLLETLGIVELEPTVTSKQLSSVDRGSYSEEKHVFYIDGVPVPVYLLVPKTVPPYHLILAFHGHGAGVSQIIGDYADEASRALHLSNDENFAQRLAQDGYLVCAIEQQGFGERLTDQVSDNGNSCRHLAFEYIAQGKTLLGERVREGMAMLNHLLTRDDIVLNAVGCTGHSGGATTALYLSALDERINVTVISGYFCDYQHSIFAIPHCECNYVPNILTLGNIDDITALIAPRPLRIIHGKDDDIFPVEGLQMPYNTVKHVYERLDHSEACSLTIHEGGHRYDYALALEWFRQWLST